MADHDFSPPKESGLTKQAVHRLAENVAGQLSFEPGGDLFVVLKKLGGRLAYKDFSGIDETDSGSLLVRQPGDFDIVIAKNTSPKRDRFTIAHEIGHYVLHYLLARQNGSPIQAMAAARYGSDRTEWEANWFAAAFLMPEQEFREAYEELGQDVFAVAERFGVSTKAARIRAEALGLRESTG
ncbi:ImmA/IrrE family metallo-endopeptidase [Azospirillum thermophilum]|uniref:ImmA/IrrE family metallo-endopeptidase n=1 Tax=Azospirillum thermophilum TaxID=2202148 RepID=A0A2S2CVR1_9PROT|nr:ImmA/IrrE family metallo-endopeptidase [Azospirillum thermophilum]AWK88495.1 ImmA/IrrE family metallo-endopeptidase [Azospirillum thermophilum]